MGRTKVGTEDEFYLGNFGDKRLESVAKILLEALVEKRTTTVRQLGEEHAQERRFGRFLRNQSVTVEEMLKSAGEQAGKRVQDRDVLVIQDTTEINYERHRKSKKGFGTVGNGEDIGLFLHPLLVIEAQTGGVLGLAGCLINNRRRRAETPSSQRPFEKRESHRWLEGARVAGRVLRDARSITMVADRESDIYEEFAACPANVDLLTRSAQDRRLTDGQLLFETMREKPIAARYKIDVPPKGKRKERQANVALRYAPVEMLRPQRCDKSYAKTVKLRAVFIEEINPPRGQPPVQWMLLTTHEIKDKEKAQEIVRWYRLRWTIEELNRTMKRQGMDIEESQIKKSSVMKKMCIMALIAAMRVIQLVRARDGQTKQKLSDGFDKEDKPLMEKLNRKHEGKTEKQKNPHKSDTLAWASWIIGRLGGWKGYYKPPGPKIMHIGLTRFNAMKQGWLLAQETKNV